MNTIIKKLSPYLTKRVDLFYMIDTGSFLKVVYKGSGSVYEWTCMFYVREAQKQLVIYSIFPGPISINELKKIGEYLTRINFDLYVGNFEMDFGDGYLRFRTTLDLTHIELTEALFNQCLDVNLQTMDKYIDKIANLCWF